MRWPTAWLLALVCVMATGCGPSGHGTRAGEEGPLSPEKVAELENPLRAKPPLEDAKDQYRAAVTQLANAITAHGARPDVANGYGHLDRLRW